MQSKVNATKDDIFALIYKYYSTEQYVCLKLIFYPLWIQYCRSSELYKYS